MREIAHRIERRIAACGRRHHQRRDAGDQQRVAVRFGLRDRRRAGQAAGAAAVLDHELLAELLAEMLRRDPAEQVRGAARRERHDDLHRPRWPGLRLRGDWSDGKREHGGAGRAPQAWTMAWRFPNGVLFCGDPSAIRRLRHIFQPHCCDVGEALPWPPTGTQDMTTSILVETKGRVGIIRFNRPQQLNALNRCSGRGADRGDQHASRPTRISAAS